jgi:hypothetical protein
MTDRDISDAERRLWRRVKDEYLGNDLDPKRDTVPVVRIAAQELPIHEARARQFVRTWSNEGLVSKTEGANYIRLTDAGISHSFEEDGDV